MEIKSLDHVCIQTDCYTDSLNFYTKILGFKLLKETPHFHTRDFNTWLEISGVRIELQTAKAGTVLNKWSSKNAGPVHIAFLVDDVKSFHTDIKQKGYDRFKMKNGEELYFVENSLLFKIMAPEGTEIEIRQVPVKV